jgi:hopene-associated glycosyltransferase HpnB
MEVVMIALGGLSLTIWLYLLFFRGGFWRADTMLGGNIPPPPIWPGVTAIVPARNEFDVIGRSVSSLLRQDYPGSFVVILADDHSSDNTAREAVEAAHSTGQAGRLTIVRAGPVPAGWTGKIWALREGVAHSEITKPESRYLWFTDADIEHGEDNLRRMVVKAEHENLDLVSLMAMLSCSRFWERLLIPPFIFFFQKLYPFSRINDSGRRDAAAAGGCVLLRAGALRRSGGLEPIRNELIDDCALARRIKDKGRSGGGQIWLGLTRSARSIRPYSGLAGIWQMVIRTAYTQLRHSPLLLAGAILGMFLTYLLPPLAALAFPWHGGTASALLGLLTWALMGAAFLPTLRLYQQPFYLALSLPLAALLYTLMTIHSAFAHFPGRGEAWKDRNWERIEEADKL